MIKSYSLKRFLVVLSIVGLTISIVGCSSSSDNKDEVSETKIEETNFTPVEFTYSDGAKEYDVKVEKPREKAVTLSQFMTEMLLTLDLGDKMVGTALLDNPILPEFEEAYNKIPELEISEGHSISKEAFIATGADFVSGWDMSISDQTTGSPDELIEKDITPFLAKSYSPDATVETVYEDFELLGKIFDVEDKATEVINKMKSDIKKITDKLCEVKEEDKVRVMVYDSGEDKAMAVGSGLANNLIELAGGENIFGEESQPYIEFLKSHPALKDIDAIKNDKIYVVGLADLSPGVRNPMVIEKMYGYFYGENN
ncbi:ABC transporter substrate-binding protein [Romboutsia ilealis]|uniref:ABC transporter substrate-binding protein n=1 Tax=Romboutsia ilealis TaxID=1115758 RepID=UPI002730055F|nr:ABC transporter substrate-binding protein [Romboutsia ilealis]